MIKLSGSAGRMGVNKKHDVAPVQKAFGAIKTKTRFGMKPLWPKKPDGRNSRDLEAATVCFQDSHKLKASGKLECTAQTMNALSRALPFSMRNQASVQGTSAAVRGPSDPGRESFRIAAETVAKAPFPLPGAFTPKSCAVLGNDPGLLRPENDLWLRRTAHQ